MVKFVSVVRLEFRSGDLLYLFSNNSLAIVHFRTLVTAPVSLVPSCYLLNFASTYFGAKVVSFLFNFDFLFKFYIKSMLIYFNSILFIFFKNIFSEPLQVPLCHQDSVLFDIVIN